MKRRAVGSIKIVVEWVEKGKDSTLVVGMNQDLEVHRASLVHQEAPSVIEKPSHISGVQRTTNQSREIVFFTCRACRVGWHWWQSSVQTTSDISSLGCSEERGDIASRGAIRGRQEHSLDLAFAP